MSVGGVRLRERRQRDAAPGQPRGERPVDGLSARLTARCIRVTKSALMVSLVGVAAACEEPDGPERMKAGAADVAGRTENARTPATEERDGAFGGTLNGRVIYEKACASCHDQGFNGAPRLVPGDWPYAEELGVDHYTRTAIAGVGIMRPRGGHPELTDAQVRAAVTYMLEQIR